MQKYYMENMERKWKIIEIMSNEGHTLDLQYLFMCLANQNNVF